MKRRPLDGYDTPSTWMLMAIINFGVSLMFSEQVRAGFAVAFAVLALWCLRQWALVRGEHDDGWG